jgi:uncharacterized membrane protein
MKRIKLFLVSTLAVMSMLPIFALVPSVVHAELNINSALCNGANNSTDPNATCTISADEGKNKVQSIVNNVVNIFSWIVGIVSVIMIIFGGFKYITSGGDSNGVTSAKNTILFAIVGLVIVALAQVIVKFVIGTVSDATTTDATVPQ